jgi:hypothetical protein
MKTAKQLQSVARYTLANQIKAKDPKWIEKMKEIMSSSEVLEKISKNSLEKWQDDEFRKKNSEGKKRSWANDPERREKVIEQFSQPKTQTHKNNMSKAGKAFNQTKEGKRLIKERADAQRGIARKKVVCPHCGKEGGEGIMIRWHFDNCKHK